MSGDFEMIKIATGERLIIQMDGTELRDIVPPPKIQYCDKCEKFKQATGGRFEGAQGLPVLWFCEACL